MGALGRPHHGEKSNLARLKVNVGNSVAVQTEVTWTIMDMFEKLELQITVEQERQQKDHNDWEAATF